MGRGCRRTPPRDQWIISDFMLFAVQAEATADSRRDVRSATASCRFFSLPL